MIRAMMIEDYEGVYKLWKQTKGFGIRSIDDSREGLERFLRRNPTTSIVAEEEERLSAVFYADMTEKWLLLSCSVAEEHRMKGIGTQMAKMAMDALRAEKINQVCLIAFTDNQVGNQFWEQSGWKRREDLNYYDFSLNEENETTFNR